MRQRGCRRLRQRLTAAPRLTHQLEDCEATELDDLRACDDGAPLHAYDFEADALAAHAAHREALAARQALAAAGELHLPPPLPPPPPLATAERARLTAYRLRAARERYARGVDGAALTAPADVAAWHALYADTDAFTQRWLSVASAAVHDAARSGVTNVLVTAGCLLPTLAKLLLFKLDGLFAHDAILSARREGKAACFARLAARYGPRARFLAVGDGAEEAAAAHAMRWAMLPVALLAEDGAMPPHAITTELLRHRLADYGTAGDDEPTALPSLHACSGFAATDTACVDGAAAAVDKAATQVSSD
jgi:hypothetical protein